MPNSDKPRGLVWHYTDIGGLHGILSSGRLRLGNVRFLNDETEFTFGWQIVSEVLDRHSSETPSSSFDFPMINTEVAQCVHQDDFFICSFSAKCDVLSQWQRYAVDGRGYCLGFDFSDLTKFGPRDRLLTLRRVIYSPDEQRQAVGADLAAAELRRVALTSDADDSAHAAHLTFQATTELVRTLAERCVTLKNPHFADEDEWRLIRSVGNREELSPNGTPICIHARGDYLKPCVDTDISALWRAHMNEHPLPLRVVVCGPRLRTELALQSVKYALKTHSYTNVEVRGSALTTWR